MTRRAGPAGGTPVRVRPPALQLQDVRKHFGGITAVDGVTVDIAAGSTVAVLGPNGAGKTTLMEMLAGFSAPTSGTVRVLGQDPRRPTRWWRARVGMVAQATALDPQLTVREVLATLATAFPDPLPVGEAIGLVGLSHEAKTPIQALSGGQRRRADLAAAVVGRPALLFLDEPTTGLDPVARRQTWHLIRQLAQRGTTVVLTTHYLDDAEQLADRILVLFHGRLIADAAPAAFRARAGGLSVRFGLPQEVGPRQLPRELRRHLQPGGDCLAATGDQAVPLLAAIVSWARVRNIDPTTLEVGPPSLEDAYLALTGAGAAAAPLTESCRA